MVQLFVGVESFNWSLSDFDKLTAFCKQHRVDGIFLKIYEIGTGEWYGKLGGSQAVIDRIKGEGVDCVGYGFFYGNDQVDEGAAITKFLKRDNRFCIDVEDGFDGRLDKMEGLFKNVVVPSGSTLYVSTWADPIQHNYLPNLQFLDNFNVIWMPQIYDDFLLSTFFSQWVHSQHPVQPTFHILNSTAIGSKSFPTFSLWEYQFALQRPDILDLYVAIAKGEHKMVVPTGWKDDGKTLTAPNGVAVVMGFRDWVLNHSWNPDNMPNEPEYGASPAILHRPDLGPGTRQTFRDSLLWFTQGTGVVEEQFLGLELSACYNEEKGETSTPPPAPTPKTGNVTVSFDETSKTLFFTSPNGVVVYKITV